MSPTPEQSDVIHCSSRNILLLAGAGSGKTRTLVWRILSDLQRGYAPETMVAITFTNAAARELKHRLAAQGVTLGFIGTLHAWAMREIQANRDVLGYQVAPRIIDEATARARFKSCLAKLKIKPAACSFVGMQKNMGLDNGRVEALVGKEYLAECRKTCTLDFEVMLVLMERLVKWEKWRHPKCIFIDEYQDTGDRDAAIYDAIRAEVDFRVGDPRQSIYSFRGGSVKHIINFAGRAMCFQLTANFRSGDDIVLNANRLIARAWVHNGREYDPMTFPGMEVQQMVSAEACVGYVTAVKFVNPMDEALGIASMLLPGGRFHERAEEVAILTRYNSRAKFIKSILAQSGIPVSTTETVEAPRVAIAALRAIACMTTGRNARFVDGDAAEWLGILQIKDLATHAAAEGVSKTAYAYRALNIKDAMPLGQKLVQMGIAAHDIRTVGYAFDGDEAATADLLELQTEQTQGEGVHVGTIHSFKGRERDYVFVAGMENESFPGRKEGAEFYEEERLAYVAFTRPREELYLTWCKTGMDSAGESIPDTTPSIFIANP